jgi:hypothetical protein
MTEEAAPTVRVIKAVSGDALLNETMTYLQRFVAYPSKHHAIAHALWVLHAHMMDNWDSTPRLCFLSPEPGSGKSRALEVTEPLVPRPVESVNVSPAYLFRKVGDPDGRPTILYDEIDTVFGPKAGDNEEIRGLLNAGHRKHSMAGRCKTVGKEIVTEEIPAYCAVALAGLGNLPDTILTRAVVVPMRRRAPNETVEPYRKRTNGVEGNFIRDRMEAWAEDIGPKIMGKFPHLPDEVVDRDADVWEALIAIADAAGGEWPEKARVSAVTLVTQSKERNESLGIKLLKDLYDIWGVGKHMFTENIVDALCELDESPWGNIKGERISFNLLANLLKPYGVKSHQVKINGISKKGYSKTDLYDPWQRYLPPSPSLGSETEVTPETEVTQVTPVTPLRERYGEGCPRCAGEGCEHCSH